MSVDFTKFTSAVSGSMATAKAALLIFPSNGNQIREEDKGAGSNAGTPQLFDKASEILGDASETLESVTEMLGDASETLEGVSEILGDASEADESVVKSQNGAAEGAGELKQGEDAYETVTFQFNPASLRISAYGGGMAPMAVYGSVKGAASGNEAKNGNDQMDYGPIDETVTVSFKVVFDAVRNQWAFLSDMSNLGPTSLIKQGADLIKPAGGTVRPIAEGFLAVVRNSSTRRVIFQWGGMRYGGYLNKAQCRYTMFDIQGEAVRAEIDLALVCSCHNGYDNGKEWRERYNLFMTERQSAFSLPHSKWKSIFNAVWAKAEKACILFRAQSIQSEAKDDPLGIGGLSRMAARISNEANGMLGSEGTLPELKDVVKAEKYVPVKIHYNPASITMHSRSGEMVTRDGSAADASAGWRLQRNAIPTETVLSMDLLFDETVNANAFMLDSGMGSPTGMVKAGSNMVSRIKGRECSVAAISELFVAAAMSAYSRMVCFVWNKLTFWGELCEADVEYTMFNNRGNPIRSKVSIRIRQDGKSAQNSDFEKIWQRAYDKLPEKAEKLASSRRLTGSSGNAIASNLFRM